MAEAPPVVFRGVTFAWEEDTPPVFDGLDIELPRGMVSLLGQNGTGKSTFFHLASGAVLPQAGCVLVNGIDTRELRDETARHAHVSVIYQNLELETEEPIGAVLRQVHEGGFHEPKDTELVEELVRVFELQPFLGRRLQEVSKGELQRSILAFSLLYGSPIVMMDEPVFALERHQRDRALEFLAAYARRAGISIYYSAHELDLTERHSTHVLLFRKGGPPVIGPTAEIFVRERIEEAYQVPLSMLKTRERLYRALLVEQAERNRAELR